MEREIQEVVEARSRVISTLARVLRVDTVRITMDDIYLAASRGVVDTEFDMRVSAVVFVVDCCWVNIRHVFELHPSMCSYCLDCYPK